MSSMSPGRRVPTFRTPESRGAGGIPGAGWAVSCAERLPAGALSAAPERPIARSRRREACEARERRLRITEGISAEKLGAQIHAGQRGNVARVLDARGFHAKRQRKAGGQMLKRQLSQKRPLDARTGGGRARVRLAGVEVGRLRGPIGDPL